MPDTPVLEADSPLTADGRERCAWADGDHLLREYHDAEWGVPVRDEVALFERVTLEAFQSGLSWLTILRKRPAFRVAFAGFDPDAVARFGDRDVQRLMADASIVRNRAKIEAAIANAAATVELRARGGLSELVWSHGSVPGPAPAALSDVPASTDASRALAGELRCAGFRFVGPTTAYALMQAVGLVDDHVARCFRRGAAAPGSAPVGVAGQAGEQ